MGSWFVSKGALRVVVPSERHHVSSLKEICNEDKEFVLKVMKLDPRDRPSAEELLEDSWFASDE